MTPKITIIALLCSFALGFIAGVWACVAIAKNEIKRRKKARQPKCSDCAYYGGETFCEMCHDYKHFVRKEDQQ